MREKELTIKNKKFLEEMYKHSQSLLNNGFDLVELQYLDEMIKDWLDETRNKLNKII